MKLLDWSKGVSLHVLYGHDTFIREAKKAEKNSTFVYNVCANVRCRENRALC